MITLIQWVRTHWVDLLALYAGLVTVASIIVKLTPSPKDDEELNKVTAFIAKYIALNK